MTGWKQEICSQRPDELQTIAPGVYMQRRNIEEVEHEAVDNMPAYTDYKCESRKITVSEYQMLKSFEDIDTSKAIDAYTMQLIEEGVL